MILYILFKEFFLNCLLVKNFKDGVVLVLIYLKYKLLSIKCRKAIIYLHAGHYHVHVSASILTYRFLTRQ